jgi:hypothetical protein
MYAAFNARDVDAVLAAMTPDVDWPKTWGGGRAIGREQVREYWKRQWTEVDSTAEPSTITELPDGRVEVRVHLVGRDPAGGIVFDHDARHVYTFRDDLVQRMTIEP